MVTRSASEGFSPGMASLAFRVTMLRRHRDEVMALEIGPNESVRKAVRRIVRKQLDRILEALESPGDRDEAVHEIRQRFKKVRAVLRLLRDELGEKTYRQHNACFRDAAQPLAELRDAMVLLK